MQRKSDQQQARAVMEKKQNRQLLSAQGAQPDFSSRKESHMRAQNAI